MRLYGWAKYRAKWQRECRRFRQGSIWIPKKQKKSPSLAANGMYLLCGDGEPGQKVFLAAKDGDQARKNSAKHTIEMWLQSEVLQAECTLNRSTLQLTHEPSRSVMYPLSSSNARTQESKEGLNGSVLVDETHVVDRAFVDRISRAGISRSEPLFLEFSTAGNNPDGYGKERYDYCQAVLDDKMHDEELFTAIYAAPQDVSDQQLEENFEHYANIANPSMGHTIDPEEIRADYERSKFKLENLANFKMYRLNIWQQSSNPWIDQTAWKKCAASFTEEDLLGRVCYGGLDLSLKWDTTAFVLLFPWEEEGEGVFRLWPYFFLPEVSAKDSGGKVSWYDWQKNGYIKITEGNATDFPGVRQCICNARDKFSLQTVAYDDKFAEAFVQDLQDEEGIDCTEFGQTPGNFAEPMGLLDNDIVTHKLQHPDNKCLNWQAGNATKNERNGMLIKPKGEVTKKIDGIVAAVMARWMMALAVNTTASFYDEHELEAF
jgi:phage terminase large subunit-like protein